jgi:hypothetical protein
MTDPAASERRSHQHDPHCPKSFPTRISPDAETGDPWTTGSRKLLCQCDELAAARKAGLGGLDLHLAYVRSRLSEGTAGVATAPEEAERLRDLNRVLNLAAEVIRLEDIWDWMRAPNDSLGGAAPLDLIAGGEQERVVELLTAPADGVTG